MKRKLLMACEKSYSECKHRLLFINKRSVKSEGIFNFLMSGTLSLVLFTPSLNDKSSLPRLVTK